MKEKVQQIQAEIAKANSILLHCHPNADPDSVGSTLAMKLTLEQMGKKVTLIQGDTPISPDFAFPGVETIVKKNFFEIDLKDFDLFLILDSGSVEMISSKAPVVFPDNLMTVVIDHHASNPGYGKINLIDPSYPAVGALLYDLFKEMGISINHDIALNLFMGIFTDTGGFRYGNRLPETFKIASELVSLAPDYQKTISIMENNHKKESLIFEALAFSSLKTFFNDTLAIVSVSNTDLVKKNISEDDIFTGYISNKIKSIKGVQVAATLIEVTPGFVKTSFRSKDGEKYDVSKLAVMLGGGGHKAAAGAKLTMPLSEAQEKVVNSAKEIYNV